MKSLSLVATSEAVTPGDTDVGLQEEAVPLASSCGRLSHFAFLHPQVRIGQTGVMTAASSEGSRTIRGSVEHMAARHTRHILQKAALAVTLLSVCDSEASVSRAIPHILHFCVHPLSQQSPQALGGQLKGP